MIFLLGNFSFPTAAFYVCGGVSRVRATFPLSKRTLARACCHAHCTVLAFHFTAPSLPCTDFPAAFLLLLSNATKSHPAFSHGQHQGNIDTRINKIHHKFLRWKKTCQLCRDSFESIPIWATCDQNFFHHSCHCGEIALCAAFKDHMSSHMNLHAH